MIVLIPNGSNNAALESARRAAAILSERGVESEVLPSGSRHEAEAAADGGEAKLAVAFGGDGTMLRTARAFAGTGIPVIGINYGTRGFLTELEPDELELLPAIVNGEYEPEYRITLDIELRRNNGTAFSGFAINDCVIKGIVKVIDLAVACGDHEIERIVGDGVIISTPTGSTGYNLSAGGPIVEPGAANMIVTPICAHALGVKPYILSPDKVVTVTVCGAKSNPCVLSVDGELGVELCVGDILTVKMGGKSVIFAHIEQKNFYKRVSEKLGETGSQGFCRQ